MLQHAGSRGGDTGGPGDGLARLLALPGADYACAVDAEGHPLEQLGDDAGPADAVIEWGRHTAAVSAARERELDDLMITSTAAYHLVRRCPVHDGGRAWVYVRVARDRGNLALTRRSLAGLTLDGRRSGGPVALPAPRRAEPARPDPRPPVPAVPAALVAVPAAPVTVPAAPVTVPAAPVTVPAALVAVPTVLPPAGDPAAPGRPAALIEVHTVPPPPPPVPAGEQAVPVPAPAREVPAPSRPAALTEVPTVPPPPPATPGSSEPSVPAPRTPAVLPNRLAPSRLAGLEAIPAPVPAADPPETNREATTSVAPTSEAPTTVAPAGAEASDADAPHPSPDGRAVPAAVSSVLPQQWSTDQSTLARLLAGLRGLTSRPSTHQAPRRGARPA